MNIENKNFDNILTKDFLIEKLFNKCIPKSKLAKIVGCSHGTVCLYFNKHNLSAITPKVKYCYKYLLRWHKENG